MKTVFWLLLLTCLACGQAVVTVTVNDFGQGMTPGVTPFANDPNRIVYSQNMYSTSLGSRQLRFGFSPLLTHAAHEASDSAVSRLMLFKPSADSAALIYTAGGRWWQVKSGRYNYGSGAWGPSAATEWEVTDDSSFLIVPWLADDLTTDSFMVDSPLSLVPFDHDSYWLRHLQVGDSVFLMLPTDAADTDYTEYRRAIKYITGDERIILTGSWTGYRDTLPFRSAFADMCSIRRYYPTGKGRPYLHQFRDYLYTGVAGFTPQIVWCRTQYGITDHDSISQMYIRPMGIVDSVYIDSAYYRYDDSVRGNSDTVLTDTIVRGLRLVDIGQYWNQDQWASDVNDNPRSYYLRLACDGTDTSYKYKTYQIVANSENALYLRVMFRTVTAGADTAQWAHLADTLHDSQIVGKMAYIYSAVGPLRTVLSGDKSLTIGSGGAWCQTLDTVVSPSQVDSLSYGSYWIYVKQPYADAGVRGYKGYRTQYGEWCLGHYGCGEAAILNAGEYVAHSSIEKKVECWEVPRQGIKCYTFSRQRYDIAVSDTAGNYLVPPSKSDERFFKIMRAKYVGDTLVFETDGPTNYSTASRVTVNEWDIVCADLPKFGDIVSFQGRLVGYGDTLVPGSIFMTPTDEPWNWTSVADDGTPLEIVVGNPTEPIQAIVPYDDGMIIFREHTMLMYPGFNELSMSDGLVGRRAVVGLNKYIYWLDVNGVKRMQRRDFSGYSIETISEPIDPIINGWDLVTYGSDVVPIVMNPQYKDRSVITYNQRDNHLYMFFAANSSTENNRCLTYDIDRQSWDGLFTIGASDAIWELYDDTARIIMGSTDSAWLTKMDYAWNDGGAGIDCDLRSGTFWLNGSAGFPLLSKLLKVHFLARSVSGAIDSGFLYIIGDQYTDTIAFTTEFPVSYSSQATVMRKWGHNKPSTYWKWRIRTVGDDTASLFQPYILNMSFMPIREDD